MNLIQFPRAITALGAADAQGADRTAEIQASLKAAQQRLMALGFKLPKFGADGKYGPETKDAIMAFQTAVGITADGGLSEETLKWLALVKPADLAPTAQAFNQGIAPTQVPKATVAPAGAVDKIRATLFPATQPFYLRPGWYIIGGFGLIVAVLLAKSTRRPS